MECPSLIQRLKEWSQWSSETVSWYVVVSYTLVIQISVGVEISYSVEEK